MLILRGGTVLPMNGTPFTGDVALENGKIIRLGENISAPGAVIHDVAGRFVMPGLVDAHSHIGLQESGTREVDHNEKAVPITPEMRAIDAIFPDDMAFEEARRFGITTSVTGPGSINLIGGTFAAVKNAGNTVEKMLIKSAVAMKAAMGENPKFRYTEMNRQPKTRMGEAALIRGALMRAFAYKKKKEAGAAQEIDMAMEALQSVVSGELPFKIHCHRADDIVTAIRIMDEFGLRYTLDHCTEGHLIPDVLRGALSRGCNGIIIGPLMVYNRKLECRNRQGTRMGSALYKEHIPFAICTVFPDSVHECLMLCAARSVAEGLPEDVALRAITIEAARITGINHRVGSIEPGKDADIAVFSKHPFDRESVCMETYINGQLVYERLTIKSQVGKERK